MAKTYDFVDEKVENIKKPTHGKAHLTCEHDRSVKTT
jgi:hypothetical protein